MPRTTVNISPEVLRQVREKARREHLSLGEAVTQLLRAGLDREPEAKPRFNWNVYDLGESTIDASDWAAVKEFLYTQDDRRLGIYD